MSWFGGLFDNLITGQPGLAGPAPVYAEGPRARVVSDRLRTEIERRAAVAIAKQAPSRDEFAAWRDEPTTQFVMAALARNADECREAWMAASWEGGEADQRKLDGLRERSDALLGFTADYEAFCQTLGLAPEPEIEDAA